MNYREKAKKLIENDGGVPWKRPKRSKISCAEISSKYLEPLTWGESLVEKKLLLWIKKHVKGCQNDNCKKVRFLLFPGRKKTHYDL